MPVGSVYEASFYSSHGEQVSVMRRYWAASDVLGTGAAMANVTGTLAAQVGTAYKAMLASTATYRGLVVRSIWPGAPTFPAVDVTGSGFGPTAGDVLPRQTRGIITLYTGNSGRAWRGRVYVPFPTEADNDTDGTPVAGYITRLQTLGAALSDPYLGVGAGGNTETLRPMLLAITYFQGAITTVVQRAEYTTYLARDRWATQRKSGSYGRPNSAVFW